MYLLAGSFLEHAAQLIGDLLVLRSVLAGVHCVARLWLLLILPVLLSEMYLRAYLLASHLLDLIKGLVEVILTTLGALVVVVHDCLTSLVTCASVGF